jgi:hypothetical protein
MLRSSSEYLSEPEPQLSPEEQAATLLFFRERGCRSVRRLAELEALPVAVVETALCRALSTLVARGYSAEWLCETFTLTSEQLARAQKAPPFGEAFDPLGWWRWPPPQGRAASLAEKEPTTAPLDEAALIAELSELLQEKPEALPAARAAAG